MKIVCYGDSNTYGWDPRWFSGNRYPDPWPERMARITGHQVINCGEPGRVVPCREEQLAWFCSDVRENHPNLLIIMLGTNDLFYTMEPGADAIAARMEKMVHYAISNHLSERILLLSCPQVAPPEESYKGILEGVSEKYREIAQREKIDYADPFHWDIPMAYDGVHFSEEGHNIFADMISNVILKLV